MRTYTFGYSRLKKAKGEGFLAREDGSLLMTGKSGQSVIVPQPLDGVDEDFCWGRLILEAELKEKSILMIYVEASGEEGERSIGPFINQTDILLCGLTGRYLKLRLEVKDSEGCVLKNIKAETPGTEMLDMMQEVYRERGSVLHRYLSVFQSVYTDFQRCYSGLGEQMDIRTCPAGMLALMEQWIGISGLDGLLDEESRRKFLMQAAHLLKIRGTRRAVREASELLAGECPQIVERNGNTVAVLFHREVSGKLEFQLLHILRWLLPEECTAHIVSWQEPMGLDEYCAMDVNAALEVWETGALDQETAMEQCVMD